MRPATSVATRLATRLALTSALAVASVAGAAAPASAVLGGPYPCGQVHVGTCYVHGEGGGYTCSFAYANAGGTEVCVFEWRP